MRHHLLLPGPDPPPVGAALSPIVDWDAWHPEHAEAARLFWAFAAQPRVSPAPRVRPSRPGPRSLEFAYFAWALDLDAAGLSDRTIFHALMGRTPPSKWEDSPQRSFIRRVLKRARLLAAGNAAVLLKPRRRLLPG